MMRAPNPRTQSMYSSLYELVFILFVETRSLQNRLAVRILGHVQFRVGKIVYQLHVRIGGQEVVLAFLVELLPHRQTRLGNPELDADDAAKPLGLIGHEQNTNGLLAFT